MEEGRRMAEVKKLRFIFNFQLPASDFQPNKKD